jgi:putative inorganic carbon (HCO3(-)) transporter
MYGMKIEGIGVMRLLVPLLLTGLALFAGPVLDFAPDLMRHDRFVPDVMWHDRQRIGQIVLLLMVAFAAATIWRKALWVALSNLPKTVRWALGLGFALGCLSVPLSAFPRFACLEWATFVLLLGLVFLLAGHARHGGACFDRWAIWSVVVLVASVIALKIMLEYLFMATLGGRIDTIALFSDTFSNRRVFGQVASMVIPLLAYPLLIGDGARLQRWGVFALLALWWMLAIASGTRGTWMALAVSAVIMAVFAWRACAGWLRIQVMALGVGVLLFAVLFVWLPSWQGLGAVLENRFSGAALDNPLSDVTTLSGRGELWAMAWAQIQAHPWLGIGPMHLAAIPMKLGAHPHNAVLQLAAEWGVPAAVALILPALLGVLRLLARLRELATPNLLLVCLTASLLAACAQSMVDGVIVIPYTQIWLALVVGWALGVYSRDAIVLTPAVPDSRVARLGIPVLSLFALTALLNGIFPEALYRVEATKAFIEAGNLHLAPRYWLVGRIP